MIGNTQLQTGPERPEFVKNEHLAFLDGLRDSGSINMFGATSVIEDAFDVPYTDARGILVYWMKTFGKDDQ